MGVDFVRPLQDTSDPSSGSISEHTIFSRGYRGEHWVACHSPGGVEAMLCLVPVPHSNGVVLLCPSAKNRAAHVLWLFRNKTVLQARAWFPLEYLEALLCVVSAVTVSRVFC